MIRRNTMGTPRPVLTSATWRTSQVPVIRPEAPGAPRPAEGRPTAAGGDPNAALPARSALPADARLTVANDNWGATSLAAVHAVAASAYDVLTAAFGARPSAPVRVARWDRDPCVLQDGRSCEIRLNTRDRYWSQYVYQFSRGLCRVMTSHGRHGEHRHQWFEEALCESAALFALYRLATAWVEAPPAGIAGARDFAPHHKTYAERVQGRRPGVRGNDLSVWLATNIGEMERAPAGPERTRVVAVALLERFNEDASLWRDCALLNQWDPRSDANFAGYLDSWAACLRANGREGRMPATLRNVFRPVYGLE